MTASTRSFVDGDNGSIIIRPNRPLLASFEHRMSLSQKRRAEFAAVLQRGGAEGLVRMIEQRTAALRPG